MEQFGGIMGVVVLLSIAVLLSTDRRRIDWRLVGTGVLLQVALAWLFLSFRPVAAAFELLATGVTRVISFAGAGAQFVFGSLSEAKMPWGFVFAFNVVPVIIFFAALMGVLYHLGIMQRVIALIAWVLRRTLRITGAEALSASANIFVGQTEAPLCIRPYLPTMTRSQLMAVMVGGFATIAGSVMAAYINMLGGESEAARIMFAKHLITASVMSAPAAIVMAKIMLPETETPRPESMRAMIGETRTTRNVVDAAAAGATDGLKLALNVVAMLIAFVALLALINWPIQSLGAVPAVREFTDSIGLPPLSLEGILGTLFAPLAWTFGLAWSDARSLGTLMGTQLIATEFVAYLKLAEMNASGAISPRAALVATYCLCGFANLPSIAIQIGGLSALAPERRDDLVALGLRAMTAGALACWMTGCVAGLFIPR